MVKYLFWIGYMLCFAGWVTFFVYCITTWQYWSEHLAQIDYLELFLQLGVLGALFVIMMILLDMEGKTIFKDSSSNSISI